MSKFSWDVSDSKCQNLSWFELCGSGDILSAQIEILNLLQNCYQSIKYFKTRITQTMAYAGIRTVESSWETTLYMFLGFTKWIFWLALHWTITDRHSDQQVARSPLWDQIGRKYWCKPSSFWSFPDLPLARKFS